AAGGVGAKQRTLGAAQQLRLGDIEHVDVTAGGAGQVDAVDVGGDRGIGAAAGGNLGVAANGHEDQRGGAGAAGHDGQAGGGALQIGQLRYLGLGQHHFIQCGDGHGSGLQAFLGFPGGDHDLVDLCHRGKRQAADGERQGGASQSAFDVHVNTLQRYIVL